MTDTDREKIRTALITHLTNLLRKNPALTYEELQPIYDDVCKFLIKKGRLKRKRK